MSDDTITELKSFIQHLHHLCLLCQGSIAVGLFLDARQHEHDLSRQFAHAEGYVAALLATGQIEPAHAASWRTRFSAAACLPRIKTEPYALADYQAWRDEVEAWTTHSAHPENLDAIAMARYAEAMAYCQQPPQQTTLNPKPSDDAIEQLQGEPPAQRRRVFPFLRDYGQRTTVKPTSSPPPITDFKITNADLLLDMILEDERLEQEQIDWQMDCGWKWRNFMNRLRWSS